MPLPVIVVPELLKPRTFKSTLPVFRLPAVVVSNNVPAGPIDVELKKLLPTLAKASVPPLRVVGPVYAKFAPLRVVMPLPS